MRYASQAVVDQTLCPRCDTNAFVRAEQIISGRRLTYEYYCGRCNHHWQFEVRHSPERRQAERRAVLDKMVEQLKQTPKKIPRAALPPIADRRRGRTRRPTE